MEELKCTENWIRYENAKSYIGRKGLSEIIPKCVDFYEGRQWAKITPNTKHIPRPVFNFCKKIVDNKASNILGSPVKLNFRADNDDESTEKFNRFAQYQMAEMKQDEYDRKACYSGLIKSNYVYYYYWDENAVGRRGTKEGGLRCEVLDPLKVFYENPTETDVQKQKWVLVISREPVEFIKKLCGSQDKKDLIMPDDNETTYTDDIEQEDNKLVTVITRFFRKNGEVYFEKSTRYCDIHNAIPMNPYLSKKMVEEKKKKEEGRETTNDSEDTQVVPNQDSNLTDINRKENEDELYKFNVYPFEVGSFNERDNCIYGISEIEPIIPNQQAINFQVSMILLNSQQMGWGKYIAKEGALRGQKITNEPGQVLIDYSAGTNLGIKLMEGQQFSNGAFEVPSMISELTRTVTNSSDVITGDMVSKDLSGTAIAQIQAQAQKPIEQMQKTFWRSKERIGKILETFYKLYYEEVDFVYDLPDEERFAREEQMQKIALKEGYEGAMPNIPRSVEDVFDGKKFQKTPFNIVVEAGKGTQYSEIMTMDFVNNLILNGMIDKISPDNLELLIDLYPNSAISNKADIKKYIRKKQTGVIAQLQQKLQEAQNMLLQAKEELEKRGTQIQALAEYTKGMQKSYNEQIKYKDNELSDIKKFMMSQKSTIENQDITNGNNS